MRSSCCCPHRRLPCLPLAWPGLASTSPSCWPVGLLQLLRLSAKGCQKLNINKGMTPLIYALSLGQEEVAGVLLAHAGKEADAARRAYLNTSSGNVTALFRCMERLPDSPLVPQLVLLGASPLDRCIRNPSKEQSTPLHLAITARQARGVIAACLGAVGVTTACCNTMLPANVSMSS